MDFHKKPDKLLNQLDEFQPLGKSKFMTTFPGAFSDEKAQHYVFRATAEEKINLEFPWKK